MIKLWKWRRINAGNADIRNFPGRESRGRVGVKEEMERPRRPEGKDNRIPFDERTEPTKFPCFPFVGKESHLLPGMRNPSFAVMETPGGTNISMGKPPRGYTYA